MSPPSTWDSTDLVFTKSRRTSTSLTRRAGPRATVSRTDVFAAPRNLLDRLVDGQAARSVSPSIASIRSPGRMPAFAADVAVHDALHGRDLVALDNAEPDVAEFASVKRLQGAVVLSADVAGMGVERADHGFQRRFDQFGFVGPVDIFVLDEGENRAEPGELTVRIVRLSAPRRDAITANAAVATPAMAPSYRKAAMPTRVR